MQASCCCAGAAGLANHSSDAVLGAAPPSTRQVTRSTVREEDDGNRPSRCGFIIGETWVVGLLLCPDRISLGADHFAGDDGSRRGLVTRDADGGWSLDPGSCALTDYQGSFYTGGGRVVRYLGDLPFRLEEVVP